MMETADWARKGAVFGGFGALDVGLETASMCRLGASKMAQVSSERFLRPLFDIANILETLARDSPLARFDRVSLFGTKFAAQPKRPGSPWCEAWLPKASLAACHLALRAKSPAPSGVCGVVEAPE